MSGAGEAGRQRSSLATLTAGLRRELAVERVSVAEFGTDGTFAIVADAGRPILSPGNRHPVGASTQIAQTAAGRLYRNSDFAVGLDDRRSVDHLMLDLRFRSGCALPLGNPLRPVGTLSISSAEPEFVTDQRLDAALAAGELLGALLRDDDRTKRATALVYTPDEIFGRGLMSLIQEHRPVAATLALDVADVCTAASTTQVDILLAHVANESVPLDQLQLALHLSGSRPVTALIEDDAHPPLPHVGTELRWARLDGPHALLELIDLATGTAPGASSAAPAPTGGTATAAGAPVLSRREGQLLQGMAQGHSTRQIARELGLSEATVKSYGRGLFRKLDAHSRGEAVAIARGRRITDSLGKPLT